MKPLLLIALLVTVASLAFVVVLALYHHKKASAGNIDLIGEIARVETDLSPEGTIIVGGELWRAKSKTGAFIPPNQRVRVVGFEGHLALVEVEAKAS